MFIGLLSVCTIGIFFESLDFNSKVPIKYISLTKQPYQARSTFVDICSYKTLIYSYTVIVNKCGGSYNTIDAPFTRVCVPNKVKNLNVKVFNVSGKWNKIFSSTWIVRVETCIE